MGKCPGRGDFWTSCSLDHPKCHLNGATVSATKEMHKNKGFRVAQTAGSLEITPPS